MIAKVFHAWERRLHAVSKDRVGAAVRVGTRLDRAERASDLMPHPNSILLDWASHAVADSQRFFDTPDTSDYTFRPGVDGATGALSFPSAMHTRYRGEQHGSRAVFPRRV